MYPQKMSKNQKVINDWSTQQIIHKTKILNFEFLLSKNYISHIYEDYYYINEKIELVEHDIYKFCNEKLKAEMSIENENVEIKKFIKDLHVYNEIKEICEALVNKIAEKKETTSKEIFKEMGFDN